MDRNNSYVIVLEIPPKNMHSIHVFSYMPGTVLDPRGTTVNRRDRIHTSWALHSGDEGTESNKLVIFNLSALERVCSVGRLL